VSLERLCRVEAVSVDAVRLLPVPGPCAGCAGCAGRCGLFDEVLGAVTLQRSRFEGEPVEQGWALLMLDEAALRAEALIGYGLPLLGLLIGAVLGWCGSAPLGLPLDASTAMLAVAGTLIGLAASKRHSSPPCRGRALHGPPF
jgi:positive regulator of sigma E activity